MKPLLYSVLPRPTHPTRDGLAIRNFHLVAALSEEFRVSAFALVPPHLEGTGEYPPAVAVREVPQASEKLRRPIALAASLASRDPYSAWLYKSAALTRSLKRAAAQERPAWVVAHSYHVGPLALASGGPSWIDFHNLDSQIWERIGKTASSGLVRKFASLQAPRVRDLERRLASGCAGVSCVSPADARVLAALSPAAPPLLVPNGVDLQRYRFREEAAAEKLLFFVGDLSWPPNAEGIRWFRSNVWPLLRRAQPEARVEILGRRVPRDLRDEPDGRLLFLGEGEGTPPFWRRSAVAIVPIRAAGGTRLKVLEAAACGVPVVSTTVGAEGLDFEPEKEILIRDEPQDFADAVSRLLDDAALRRRLAVAARSRVEKSYDWLHIGRGLARELRSRAA